MADRSVVIRLRGDIGDLQAKMVAAGKSVGMVADKMTSAEKDSQKFRRGLDSVGTAGGRIGLVAAAGLTAVVATTAKFESAMSSVQAATHETASVMGDLREAAIQAGADTVFSASEAASAIENLAKAGVSSADILNGGLQGALDLAAAGTIAVADAAEVAATAMTQFGLSGDQVPHIADLLAAAAGKAQGEVSDMAFALKQSGLVADQMGLSIEETTGALAAFASAGLLGSDAGTSFKTMLMRLLPQTKEAGDAMEAIGFNAFDAAGNLKSLEEIAGGLRQGLKGMSAEQRQATLATIFGQDAIRAATVLYEQGARGVGEWTDKVNDQGYAAETAAIKMDNLKGDVEQFTGSLETAFIKLGSSSQEGLRGMVQNATDAVNAFSGLPDAMQGTVTQMLALTAITGGGLWFGSKVITGIADTRAALDDLNKSGVGASRALGAVSTALKVGAVLEGLNLLDTAINETFDQRLDESALMRSLDALAQGRVEGEILGQYGEDLKGFADDVDLATSKFTAISRFANKIPLAGGFIAGDTADALADFQKLDEAFASMVEGGQGEKAADLFSRLNAAAVASGHSASEVAGLFDQYQQALDNAANEGYTFTVGQRSVGRALDETSAPAQNAARDIDGVGRAARDAASDADALDVAIGNLEVTLSANQRSRDYEQALDDLGGRFKERRGLLRDLKEAQGEVAGAKTAEEADAARQRVADLKDQLKDFALTLDIGEQAGRDWQAALEDLASKALEAGSDLEGMDRVRYLNNARKDFIDMATKITGSRKEAVKLADDLELVHQKKVKPEIDVDTKPAEVDVRKFYRWLENLPPATVRLMVDTLMGKNDIGEKGDPRFARGFASGGYTGNRAVDSIAGVVHGREFVFDAQMTAMYRPLFEAMHRTRKVPGYREGGYVAAQTSTTNYYGGGEIDYDRLAAAMSRARPIYGDAHFHSDGDYERAKRDHARTTSGGGVTF